ncbi:sigma-70 family RNA polymerase sigma factor [Rhodospirillaceae bacterium SYSU D60014]|uniref:sigma-70 family RNA polymerase sigma factor n=1 Tax=Virgifigura deserti TaxID=2268457 RepID=UPI000E65F6CB
MAGSIDELLIETIPHLRAFARALTRDRDLADDLVQETVVRALSAANQFRTGTNFRAWIFTILRNHHINTLRGRRMRFDALEDVSELHQATPPTQEAHLEIEDFQRAFMGLPVEQREVLLLVGASGFSYEEASRIVGCAVGTIKSRVSRARRVLYPKVMGDADEATDSTDRPFSEHTAAARADIALP